MTTVHNFGGKRALVTGAGQGIGRALCKKLVSCGAEVIALSRTKANLDSLKKECPSIKTVCLDLAKPWKEISVALSDIGPVQLLVNNAGMAIIEPFMDMPEEHLDEVMTVNFKSMAIISKIVAKGMINSKQGGSIVNVSSIASITALTGHASYAASKAAMDMMSKVMALELGQHQIRVNCVNPTVVFTELGRANWSDPEKLDPLVSRTPLGRVAEVDDVLNAILFLLSDESAYINGITMPIEGGLLTTGSPVPHDKMT